MYSEPEPDTATRMRQAHATAVATLQSTPIGSIEAWGWRGRTLSRPVAAPFGDGWLRLVCAPADKAGGKLWEGPREAEAAIPSAVPRPRLHGHHTWTEGEYGYLAELYEKVTESTVTTVEPILRKAPDLNSPWWSELCTAVDAIAEVPTERVAVRQEYLDRAMPQYLGVAIDTTVPAWSTAHGDLHWANLTSPDLMILDWEGWGAAPAGYDAALLHSYSLLVPETAADVRRHLGHVLDTPTGQFAELAVITELLQTTTRGDNLELEEPLRARLAHLLSQTPCARPLDGKG